MDADDRIQFLSANELFNMSKRLKQFSPQGGHIEDGEKFVQNGGVFFSSAVQNVPKCDCVAFQFKFFSKAPNGLPKSLFLQKAQL